MLPTESLPSPAGDARVRACVFDAMPDAVLVADDRRRYVDANQAACALLGVAWDELLGRTIDDFAPPPPGFDVDGAWRQFLEAGSQDGELSMIRADGSEVIVEFRAIAHVAPGRHLSVLRDVTRRREQENRFDAATRERAALAEVLDEMRAGVLVFDREWRAVYRNRVADAQSTIAREQLGDRPLWEVFPELADTAFGRSWREAAESGALATASAYYEPLGRWYETSAFPTSVGVAVVFRDTTEERARETALAELAQRAGESRAILDALVENAPVGFGLVDTELRFRVINQRLADMNGLPPEAHIGKKPRDLLPGIPIDDVERVFHEVLATSEPRRDVEVAGETPAMPGVQRSWLEQWYPVVVDGRTIGVGIVAEEVTEQRRLADEREQNERFREMFVATLGHDLRNPLSAVTTGAALLLRRGTFGAEDRRVVERIQVASERMGRMIEQILDVTRVRLAGGLPLVRREGTDLRDVLREVTEELAGSNAPNVVLHVTGRTTGAWDDDRLAQVLSNLLGNAIEHGAGAPVHVTVAQSGASHVEVRVANGGTPIDGALVPFLFDPFRKGERRGKRSRGLGLGLYISQQIVLAHGGALDVRSSAESGTVFTVRLPYDAVEPTSR